MDGAHFKMRYSFLGLPWWLSGKESTCNAGNPSSILGELPTPVFLPGNLVVYSSWGLKELDMTEQLTFIFILSLGM